MAKIYFVRHQAHGIVPNFPFKEHPTQEQVALVAKWCFQQHGFGHPKTPGEPYWTRVAEFDLLGPTDLPDVPDRVLAEVGGAPGAMTSTVSGASVHGTGVIGVKEP